PGAGLPWRGSGERVALLEDGGGLRAPGETVRLSCRGSGFSFRDYGILWYRQAAGGGLEWVSFIEWRSGTRKQYGAGVQGRATASRDNSRSESILSLRDLQPRDSARYFCAVRTGTGNPLWGKGLLGVGASGQFPGSEVPSLCTPGVPGLSCTLSPQPQFLSGHTHVLCRVILRRLKGNNCPTVVSSMGCRGMSALVSGAPPPPPCCPRGNACFADELSFGLRQVLS
uniref:Ig-like domain-containing protein n=1 Tax=Aquila chrysaetos chrysaetos TaxID=223781 RepID=A0A663DMK8_AQUCH